MLSALHQFLARELGLSGALAHAPTIFQVLPGALLRFRRSGRLRLRTMHCRLGLTAVCSSCMSTCKHRTIPLATLQSRAGAQWPTQCPSGLQGDILKCLPEAGLLE